MRPFDEFEFAYLKVVKRFPKLDRGKGRMVVSALKERRDYNFKIQKKEKLSKSLEEILSMLCIKKSERAQYRVLVSAIYKQPVG